MSCPRIYTSEITKECQIGDILLSVRAPVGTVAKSIHKACIGRGISAIRAKNQNLQEYLYQWLFSFESYWKNISQGGTFDAVNSDDIKNLLIPIPKLEEQKKIASCFSSLDELITSHKDKLEALKDHKKGLLQNLFPSATEGERSRTPNYRFPEFEKDGEWVEKSIEDVSKITTGNKDTQDKIDDGKYPFFVRSQSIERINSYSYDGEAILTSGDGVGVGKIYHYIVGKFDFHQRVYCIYEFEEDIEGKFVFYFFSEHFYNRVMQLSAKNSVDSVRRAMITEMPIVLPPTKEEQQKIASCLSAVDELITAQAEKIAQLQEHKKGLMQGLFPKIKS